MQKFMLTHGKFQISYMERSNLRFYTVRWGLIGASTIAAEHMINALRGNTGEIVWLVSGNQAHASTYAHQNAIGQISENLEDALNDNSVDAVYISSTNEKHLPQAMAAISAGKHVLCEKPLAMSVADGRAMVNAAAGQGVVFATNHHLRNAGSHMAIRDIIQAGTIGKVLSARVHHAVYLPAHLQGWRINSAAAGGGVIADITVHDADTIRFHLGEDPAEVTATSTMSGLGTNVEDSVMSIWSMPSGAQVMAHDSFTHHFAGNGIEFHGTEGSIFGRGIMTQQPVGEVELVTQSGCRVVPFSPHTLYGEAVRRFNSAVAGQGYPAASGDDGVRSLAVAVAVEKATATGLRTQVDYKG